jgi:hypothetical protein
MAAPGAAMLAADPQFDLGVGGPAKLAGHLHQFADSGQVQYRKEVVCQNLVLDIKPNLNSDRPFLGLRVDHFYCSVRR